jgi:hypothetical protein
MIFPDVNLFLRIIADKGFKNLKELRAEISALKWLFYNKALHDATAVYPH